MLGGRIQRGWRPQACHRAYVVSCRWPATFSQEVLTIDGEQHFRTGCPGGLLRSSGAASGAVLARRVALLGLPEPRLGLIVATPGHLSERSVLNFVVSGC